jgi:hypothetical protein
MCGSGELGWNEGRLKRLPEEGKEGGLKGTYCMQSFSQAILPGLIQRLRDAGLTKAPRTSGLQDFLRIMSTGRCTWDHLLWENIRNYKLCSMRIKFISHCLGHGLIPALIRNFGSSQNGSILCPYMHFVGRLRERAILLAFAPPNAELSGLSPFKNLTSNF